MRKTMWVGAAVGSLLAGCSGMQPRIEHAAKQQECDEGKACVIGINVACTRFYGCELSVDYDLTLVKGRGKPLTIVWRLAGESGARFPSDGIVVESSEFRCAPKPETNEFMCEDKHSDFGVFKYRINVAVPQSLFGARGVSALDPWIVNN